MNPEPVHLDKCFPKNPQIPASAFVAPGASLIGDVVLGEEVSIWFQAVLRGDINSIRVGDHSNIQDGCVVHLDDAHGTTVGEWVTCGHKAILHGCTVEDEVLVGMGAILLDGVKVGPRCIIGANTLITAHTEIPEGALVLGSPGKVVKTLDRDVQQSIRTWAARYVKLSRRYLGDPRY